MDESVSLPPFASLSRNAHGREFLDIAHPRVQAKIALEGAHIVSCTPTGQGDLLWMSPVDKQIPGTPLRGGIPVCWPWFGGERPGPSHGIARISQWRLVSVVDKEDQVRVSMELPQTIMQQQLPDDHWRLQIEFVLGKALCVSLATTNIGSQPQVLSQALHSYLAVRDIRETRIWGLEDAEFLDQLTGVDQIRQQGPVTFSSEVDRIYHGHSGSVQLDDGGPHYWSVQREGSRSLVVWNPWIDKSQRLGQYPADGYKEMVCIEAANAGADRRVLGAGERHVLRTEIKRV
jgi:glucose-6-phosphate 1-epimerase